VEWSDKELEDLSVLTVDLSGDDRA